MLEPSARLDGGSMPDEVVFSRHQIRDRVSQLAAAIDRAYAGQFPVIIGVQPGAQALLDELLAQLMLTFTLDSIAVSRYPPAPDGRPTVRLVRDLQVDVQARPVLLVMDVFDTGLTYHFLCQSLIPRFPASLDLCALLTRPGRRLVDLPVRFAGFEAPEAHLVGYGLAFDGQFADLPDIRRLALTTSA